MGNQTHIPLEERRAGAPTLESIWELQRHPRWWMLECKTKQTMVGIERHIRAKGFVSDCQKEAVESVKATLEGLGR